MLGVRLSPILWSSLREAGRIARPLSLSSSRFHWPAPRDAAANPRGVAISQSTILGAVTSFGNGHQTVSGVARHQPEKGGGSCASRPPHQRGTSSCRRTRNPTRRKSSERFPQAAFEAAKRASPVELSSAGFVSDSIAFWSRRLRQLPCPRCRVLGTLGVYDRAHGLFVYCTRNDCAYETEYVYHGKAER